MKADVSALPPWSFSSTRCGDFAGMRTIINDDLDVDASGTNETQRTANETSRSKREEAKAKTKNAQTNKSKNVVNGETQSESTEDEPQISEDKQSQAPSRKNQPDPTENPNVSLSTSVVEMSALEVAIRNSEEENKRCHSMTQTILDNCYNIEYTKLTIPINLQKGKEAWMTAHGQYISMIVRAFLTKWSTASLPVEALTSNSWLILRQLSITELEDLFQAVEEEYENVIQTLPTCVRRTTFSATRVQWFNDHAWPTLNTKLEHLKYTFASPSNGSVTNSRNRIWPEFSSHNCVEAALQQCISLGIQDIVETRHDALRRLRDSVRKVVNILLARWSAEALHFGSPDWPFLCSLSETELLGLLSSVEDKHQQLEYALPTWARKSLPCDARAEWLRANGWKPLSTRLQIMQMEAPAVPPHTSAEGSLWDEIAVVDSDDVDDAAQQCRREAWLAPQSEDRRILPKKVLAKDAWKATDGYIYPQRIAALTGRKGARKKVIPGLKDDISSTCSKLPHKRCFSQKRIRRSTAIITKDDFMGQ